jgi:hypothetical protein
MTDGEYRAGLLDGLSDVDRMNRLVASRDAIIRAWLPVMRYHLAHHPGAMDAVDMTCPGCKPVRALASEHHPDAVEKELSR